MWPREWLNNRDSPMGIALSSIMDAMAVSLSITYTFMWSVADNWDGLPVNVSLIWILIKCLRLSIHLKAIELSKDLNKLLIKIFLMNWISICLTTITSIRNPIFFLPVHHFVINSVFQMLSKIIEFFGLLYKIIIIMKIYPKEWLLSVRIVCESIESFRWISLEYWYLIYSCTQRKGRNIVGPIVCLTPGRQPSQFVHHFCWPLIPSQHPPMRSIIQLISKFIWFIQLISNWFDSYWKCF